MHIGTENEIVFSGTKGRAEASNNPKTALWRTESFSRNGYWIVDEHPEAKGAKTLFGSVSSKFVSIKRP